jgi:hypothetical protein
MNVEFQRCAYIAKKSVLHEVLYIRVSFFKGIVSRDLHILYVFLIPFDRSEVSTHKERVLLLLKFCFRVEFFDFCVSA